MSSLETFFGVSVVDTSLRFSSVIGGMCAALILGIIVAAAYMLITDKSRRSLSFFLSLIILPAVVAVIISLVGSNIAGAFSIAGVFTLIRFRSAPGDGKDITLIFLTMAAGLACAFGFITIAFVVVIVLTAILIALNFLGSKFIVDGTKQLRIMVPEDMNYQGAFDDLFEKYTNKANLLKVKTTNMGTLFELTFDISEKKDVNEKEFIDEIRCRNGNLTVMISTKELKDGTL